MHDLPAIAPIATLAIATAGFGWTVWVWFAGARQRELTKLQDKVAALAKDLDTHRNDGSSSREKLTERLIHLEERLDHIPTAESQHRLELGLVELRGAVATMAESIKPLGETSRRIEDYLMGREK